MSTWDVPLYLRYQQERAQPARDLLSRLQLENAPRRLVDLGCGAGNVTALLREKWPRAEIIGIDSSAQMIAAARREYSRETWRLADIASWRANEEMAPDLVFSNAALQWLPRHQLLMPQLFSQLARGGALAVQMPSDEDAPLRRIVREVAQKSRWGNRMEAPLKALTFRAPEFYYDVLCRDAARLEIWETEYSHAMENVEAILDWYRGTGLRPFLEALHDDEERATFLAQIRDGYAREYSRRADGRVLLPFRRLFFIASR